MAEGDTYATYSCELCEELDRDEMVSCDLCSRWYHFSCVDITSIGEEDDWVCLRCKDEVNEQSSSPTPKILAPQPTVSTAQPSSSTPHDSALHNQPSVLELLTPKSAIFIPEPNIRRMPRHSWANNQHFDNNRTTNQRLTQSFVDTRNENDFISTIPPRRTLPISSYVPRPHFQFRSPNWNVVNYATWRYNNQNPLTRQPMAMTPSPRQQVPSQQVDTISEMSRRTAERLQRFNVSNSSIYPNYRTSDQSSMASTMRSSISSHRQLIQLARIEEERALQEERDTEYLRRKYSILLDDYRDEGCIRSVCTDRSKFTEDWLKDNHRSKSSFPDTNVDQRHDPVASEVIRFRKRLDGIQFESTSPVKREELDGKCNDDRSQRFWETPERKSIPRMPETESLPIPYTRTTSSLPNQFVSNLFDSQNVDQKSGNSQVRVIASDDQCTLTKAQIAARHVITKELPIFYGKPEDWPMFISRFNNSTKVCGFSNQENLDRLQKCLKGSAMDAVRSRLLTEESVPEVIETLRMLFGRPDLIINSMLQNIREEPAPKADKLNTIVDFALKVGNLSSVMTQTGLESHLSNPTVMQELVNKLPTNIRIEWARFTQTRGTSNLATLGQWLRQLAMTISMVTEPTVEPERKCDKFENKSKPANSFTDSNNRVYVHQETSEPFEDEKSGKSKQCLFCRKECQKVDDCPVFISFDVDRRWKELYNNKLCRKCLSRHGKFCNQDKSCGTDGCVYKHHYLLHDKKKHSMQATSSTSGTTVDASNNSHSMFTRRVLFRIVPVDIHAGGKSVSTFAYLDDGSDLTIANKSLIERLGIRGTLEPLCLLWTGDVHRNENNSLRVTFNISGADCTKFYV